MSKPLMAYVWGCGDYDYCDCTQFRIVRNYRPYDVVYEGRFLSDSQYFVSLKELNRTAHVMRKRWHDVYERIEWPWDVEKSL